MGRWTTWQQEQGPESSHLNHSTKQILWIGNGVRFSLSKTVPVTYFSHLLYLPKQWHHLGTKYSSNWTCGEYFSVKLYAHQLDQKGTGFLFVIGVLSGLSNYLTMCSSVQATFTQQSSLLLDFSAPRTRDHDISIVCYGSGGLQQWAERRAVPRVLPSYFSACSDSVITVWAVVGSTHPGTWPSSLKKVASVCLCLLFRSGVISAVGSSTA